ncbi:MAG: hypothetical protein AAFR59_02215, partial [Bacteroidota bacterium]
MSRILAVLSLLFVCGMLPAQGILPGIVTYQNSGNQPVVGAAVKVGLTQSILSNDKGLFVLRIPGKAPGYEVRIYVNKDGYEVVNKEDLTRYALRADDEVRLKIYLCPLGRWEKFAMQYYRINEKKITLVYRRRVSRINAELKDEQLRSDSLKTLAEQFQLALAQAEELAQIFAIANLDDASILFRKAHDYFARGEIDSALVVLAESKLDDLRDKAIEEQKEADMLEKQAQTKRDTAAKTLADVIEGYTLRARLQIHRFLEVAEGKIQRTVVTAEDCQRFKIFVQRLERDRTRTSLKTFSSIE